MPLVNLSQIVDKDLFSEVQGLNVRAFPSMNPTSGVILRKIKKGERIGKVYSYVEGRDVKNDKDGSTWFELYERYDNKNLPHSYVKYNSSSFSLKKLKEQGTKTIEEQIKEKEKKEEDDKKTFWDELKNVGLWVGLFWLGGKAISNKKS